ncbi:acyl carrier protein [Burkholderia sp. FERM BP-3421]|uniref:acyl carrier protein n=1 Tax=Burkholderia sp. FERM BP-3421 TaxID=1494466 RepID=UPI002361FEC5|nr:acyl carrier protein [Burkholderia sp. FERM BP-3421]WDD95303.1 acyl carrier protein [Burkholderia sp. FERM BP-3421]
MNNELRTIIKDVAHLEVPIDTVANGDDLYEAGLSSLNTIQLLLAIEHHFNIEVPDDMLNRQLFQSIDSLAGAVTQLQRAAQSA